MKNTNSDEILISTTIPKKLSLKSVVDVCCGKNFTLAIIEEGE